MEKTIRILTKIMAVIGLAVMLFLVFYSWRYTKRLYYSEVIVDEKDSLLWNLFSLVIAACFVAFLGWLANRLSKKILLVIAICCMGFVAVFGGYLAWSADIYTVADQAQVYLAAQAFATGDLEWLNGYEYFRVYPFQFGLVEIYSLILRLTGTEGYLGIVLTQAIATGFAVFGGFFITREIFDSRKVELIYLALALTFLPIYHYAMFIYGEAFGVCFMTWSVYFFLRANREKHQKKEWLTFMLLSVLFMTIAYVTRSAVLIAWVALTILQILICMKRKKASPLLGVVVMILAMSLGQSTAIKIAENKIGQEYESGCPSVMWIAMGMMEDEGGNLAGPGSANDFNRLTFIDCDFDAEESSAIAKNEIKERMGIFLDNPNCFFRFYKEKILCQWNEPTYGVFRVTSYQSEPKEWVSKVYMDETVSARVRGFLNRYQAVCYLAIFGAFLSLFLGKYDLRQLFPLLLFLGGFFFSILWETKSRYAYPYMVMVLPGVAASMSYYVSEGKEIVLKMCGKFKKVTKQER